MNGGRGTRESASPFLFNALTLLKNALTLLNPVGALLFR